MLLKRWFCLSLLVILSLFAAQAGAQDDDSVGWWFEPLEGTDDALFFSQGDTLYVTFFDGQEPELVTEFVAPPTVALTPDTTRVTFVAFQSRGRRPSLKVVDSATLDVQTAVRISSQYGFMGPWSPDGGWFVLYNFPNVFLVRADGSQDLQIGRLAGTAQVFTPVWLADNTLVVVDQNQGGQQPVGTVHRFDPAAGEEMEVPEEVQGMFLDIAAHLEGVAQQIAAEGAVMDAFGVGPAYTLDFDGPPLFNLSGPPPDALGVPEFCGTWEVQQQEVQLGAEPVTLYSVGDTVFLSNLNVLDDGTVLFLRWYFEDCDHMRFRAALMRIKPGDEPEVLAHDVDVGASSNLGYFFADTGNRMAVSSEGRYVVWIGGGIETGETTLNLIDLETGEPALLARDTDYSSGFYTDTGFSSVMWAPHEQ
jgi:hypothetical protein